MAWQDDLKRAMDQVAAVEPMLRQRLAGIDPMIRQRLAGIEPMIRQATGSANQTTSTWTAYATDMAKRYSRRGRAVRQARRG